MHPQQPSPSPTPTTMPAVHPTAPPPPPYAPGGYGPGGPTTAGGPGAAAPLPPAATAPAEATANLPTLAQVVAAILTVVALALSSGGQGSWYSTTTTWSVFATVAAVVQLVPAFAKQSSWSPARRWAIGAAGAGGLAAWWVLIALPGVSSDQGFVATMAVAAAGVGTWLSPARPR